MQAYVEKEKSEKYRKHADHILKNLYEHYQSEPGSNYGFLLLHSVGHYPGGSEIDVPLNYADYYYLEAAARKEALDLSEKI